MNLRTTRTVFGSLQYYPYLIPKKETFFPVCLVVIVGSYNKLMWRVGEDSR